MYHCYNFKRVFSLLSRARDNSINFRIEFYARVLLVLAYGHMQNTRVLINRFVELIKIEAACRIV